MRPTAPIADLPLHSPRNRGVGCSSERTGEWRSGKNAGRVLDLREVLGDKTYESFAQAGAHMTNAEMATYALDQIEQAHADLT